MECVIFDIETAPDPRIWDDHEFVNELRDGLSAPSNWKDPVKIAANIDEQADKLRDKAALSPCLGKIRAIGWADLNDDVDADAVASEGEAEVIETFVERALSRTDPTLLGGFYVRTFDVPFVTLRAAVHNISLPSWWPMQRQWDRIVDPVDIFGRDTEKLARYLRALNLPPKLGDGVDAPDMPLDELLTYVKRDVECERALIQRLRPHFTALRRPGLWQGS